MSDETLAGAYNYAKEQLWEGKTAYYAIAPMLEFIYSELWRMEEFGAGIHLAERAIAELDEYLYERLDV